MNEYEVLLVYINDAKYSIPMALGHKMYEGAKDKVNSILDKLLENTEVDNNLLLALLDTWGDLVGALRIRPFTEEYPLFKQQTLAHWISQLFLPTSSLYYILFYSQNIEIDTPTEEEKIVAKVLADILNDKIIITNRYNYYKSLLRQMVKINQTKQSKPLKNLNDILQSIGDVTNFNFTAASALASILLCYIDRLDPSFSENLKKVRIITDTSKQAIKDTIQIFGIGLDPEILTKVDDLLNNTEVLYWEDIVHNISTDSITKIRKELKELLS
jgi:hypothetical protein